MLLIFIYATGCWIGEALALTWAEVDFNNSVIQIASRVGARREIPIGADLKELLERHLQNSGADFVFATTRGKRLSVPRATIHFRRVRKLVGIKRTDGLTIQPNLRDLRQHADSPIMPNLHRMTAAGGARAVF